MTLQRIFSDWHMKHISFIYLFSLYVASFWAVCGIASPAHAELPTSDFIISVDTPEHNDIRVDSIDTIINSKAFTIFDSSDNSAGAGNTPWVKVEWNKNKMRDEKFIINDFTSQAYEDYYLIKDNQVLQSYSSGFTDRFDERPIKHYKFVADVSDADYMLVKTCCNPGLPIYFRMLNAQELNSDYYHGLIWYCVVYALIAMMILYNFFIFLYLREKQYLYYCYYLLSMLLMLLTLSGLGKQFVWPNLTRSETLYFISGLNVSIASMLFQLAFLNHKYLTTFNKRLMYGIISLHLLVFVFYLLGDIVSDVERIANMFVQFVSIVGWLITDYVIFRNILAGDRSARVLLFSYLLINIAGAIFIMRYNGYLVHDSLWAEHIVDIAVLAESLILSLALAQKIQKLRDEKSQAKKKQLAAQKQFSQQLMEVQEEEKRQLGSALHDNFTHQLLILKTSLAKKLGITATETQHVDDILNDMRNLSHMIHPYLLEKLGLTDAIADMADKVSQTYGLDIHLASDKVHLSKQQSFIIYRIVQESLNNIVKHAEASECLIAIKQHDGIIDILIKDDGKGFDIERKQGLGITTIKERCNMLQGVLDIQSDTNGSRLHITFPYEVSMESRLPIALEGRV